MPQAINVSWPQIWPCFNGEGLGLPLQVPEPHGSYPLNVHALAADARILSRQVFARHDYDAKKTLDFGLSAPLNDRVMMVAVQRESAVAELGTRSDRAQPGQWLTNLALGGCGHRGRTTGWGGDQ